MQQSEKRTYTYGELNQIIGMAWADRVTFEEIYEKTGVTESEVIQLMRQHIKPSSFARWRKRVSGRLTKHRALFEARDHQLQEDSYRN